MNVNLILLKNDGSRKCFSLPGTVTAIGRRQDCDLCIPLMVISRRHCELNMEQEILTVRDLGSRNGTFVNGERVDETILEPGDKMQIGPLNFIVQIDGDPQDKDLPQPTHPAADSTMRSVVNTDLNRTEIIAVPPEDLSDSDNDDET